MPTLTLIFHGEPLAFTLEKIDRAKLYGYVDVETVDADGAVCQRATLAGDGHTLAGKGDTAIAYLDPDGNWRERSELRAVDAVDGAAIIPVKPTFAFPVNLDGKETTLDDYLAHSIRLVYQLTPFLQTEASSSTPPAALAAIAGRLAAANDKLAAKLQAGAIFRFPFSYRGGDLADAGFLLSADGNLFLAVGAPIALQYARLDAPAAIPDPDEDDEDDELDFSDL